MRYNKRMKPYQFIAFALIALTLPTIVFAQVTFPNRGGTGTSVPPTVGQILIGQANGTYSPVATTTLGVTATVATSTVRSALSATLPATYNSTTGVIGVSTAGDWTGTFDGQQGSYYLNRANQIGTQLAATISDFVASVRTSISETIAGLTYNSSTGVLALDSGYVIPLTASTSNWQSFYVTPSSRITGGTGVSWTGNTLDFDCSEVEGTGINCVGEAITLDATGAWTGTFDGLEGTAYLARANHTGTQLASTISDFQTTVSANTDVTANTAARHSAVTVAGTPDYITLAGQVLTRNQIDLTTDVIGLLPSANIASDIARDSELHSAVTVSGTRDYITLSGQDLVRGVVDISDDTNLTGNSEIVLTGDALSIASTIARDSELHSAVTVSGAFDYITLVGQNIVRGAIDLATDVTGVLDISTYTNLAAGRSLTLTGDTVDADAELYTRTASAVLEDPTTADLGLVQLKLPTAATITRVSCSTDTGTATIQLDERAEATPNTAGTDIMSSTLVCDSTSEATTSFANAGITANAPISLDVDAVASTPGLLRLHVEYTVND